MSVPPGMMQAMMGPQSQARVAEEGEWIELPQSEDSEVAHTPDGGMDVALQKAGKQVPTADETDFYDNLVEMLDEQWLDTFATDLLQKIDRDKDARSKADERYAEGIRRTGIGNEAPGGADFQGASKAVHPMLTKAAIEFEARAMKEVFPAQGPCKSMIPGTLTKERLAKAERERRCFNWLFTTQMLEFRPLLEQTLIQSSLGGDHYLRFRWHHQLRRPTTSTVHRDKVLLPYDAPSMWAAERVTLEDDVSEFEYRQRIRDGIYRDVDLIPPSMRPNEGKAAQARAKAEGKQPDPYNQDGTRRTFEVSMWIDEIEDKLGTDYGEEGQALPYLVFIDETTHKIAGIVRNWEMDDDRFERMQWIVEWPFVPWDGAYAIGMVHLIGSISAGATGALRALLDAGHIQNFATAFALKGGNVSGQSQQVKPTQINYIKGGVGSDDIRKLVYAVNNQGPSVTLFQLLGFLVQEGEDMIRTTFENLSENNPNAPVGTTFALIEQGLSVVTTIIGRMHFAMFNCLQVVRRILRMYVTDDEIRDQAGELLAYRADFQGPSDVVPVSDPGMPSDAHRMAQMQVVAQRSDMKPMLYNQRRVEKLILERLRVPDPDSFLVPIAEPQEMNAANENAALIFGKPILAFPHQDHIAHLQTHIDFMNSPMLGMLPNMAPKVMGPILEHLSQHIALWYLGRVYHSINVNMDGDLERYMSITDDTVKQELDRTIAEASQTVVNDAQHAFQQMSLPAIIQRAQQMVKQMTPPPQDPRAQAELQREGMRQETAKLGIQTRSQDANQDRVARLQDAREQRQADAASEQNRQGSENQRQAAGNASDMRKTLLTGQLTAARTEAQDATKERINLEDNRTALQISSAEIAAGKKASLSTGRGTSREGRGVSQ